ncbi:MAG: flagellar basal body P-ring formation chaperone FlgA [Acidobacteriota bacterium]
MPSMAAIVGAGLQPAEYVKKEVWPLVWGWCLCLAIAVMFVGVERLDANSRWRLTAPSQVTIRGDRIYLGTVVVPHKADADLIHKLDSTLVGLAPPPGRSKLLLGAEIRDRLRSIGVDEGSFEVVIPEEVMVQRESQFLTQAAVIEALEAKWLPLLPWKNVHIQGLDFGPPLELPAGRLDLAFDYNPRSDLAKPIYVGVTISIEDQTARQLFLRTTLTVQEVVAVAARELPAGERVGSQDLRWEMRKLSSTLRKPVQDEAFLEDRRPRTTIAAGEILSQDLFVEVPLIKRGQAVSLVFEEEGIRLRTQGKAVSSGVRGDIIQVINPDSGKRLNAEVVGEGIARVH